MGSKVLLALVRVLVVVIALGVVGLGAFAKILIHDIEVRGNLIVNLTNMDSQGEDAAWRAFIRTAVGNQLRIWVAIATGSFSALATLLVLFGFHVQRMRLPTAFLLPLELLSALSMATAFAATLSLALSYPSALSNPNSSADLASFAMLLPLSRAYAIASGTGMFLGLTATMSFLIQAIHRLRDSKACSFEPTGSALSMSYGYQVPPVNDSRAGSPSQDEEKGLAGAAAAMGTGDSAQSKEESPVDWPLAVAQKMNVANIRPHRPWSEMPKK
ncbi:hypothetical protein BU23DRAFT_594859 [Bimuria novae-zelandiae CBS 107.79]|uniref:Uncharacterized protein n=1 Tax=Bimuria novae-zelandiae CBS 107.79 TaxID=1447943 RepID=A0A6A5VQY7_9PLEO|nr:hypothetical protein BU23DRAFT_594859 [Bimuria novae-zelandiae CBS 107.79]